MKEQPEDNVICNQSKRAEIENDITNDKIRWNIYVQDTRQDSLKTHLKFFMKMSWDENLNRCFKAFKFKI